LSSRSFLSPTSRPGPGDGDGYTARRATKQARESRNLEKGTYQHPDLYGQPPELGMDYRSEPQRGHAADPAHPADEGGR